jgi:hypothetical protein
MQYQLIAGEPDCVIWLDDKGNSGVIRPGNDGWDAYQAFLSAGGVTCGVEPAQLTSLDELKAAAFQMINAEADTALVPLTSQYPRGEIDSWPEQCIEARAWLQDQSQPTPLVDAIEPGMDTAYKELFCHAILDKAEAYKVSVGAVIAWRRAVSFWVDEQNDMSALLTFEPHFPEVPANAS